MAYVSSPGFKVIFVGDRPLGLTRLNRNEPGAFRQSPEATEKKEKVFSTRIFPLQSGIKVLGKCIRIGQAQKY